MMGGIEVGKLLLAGQKGGNGFSFQGERERERERERDGSDVFIINSSFLLMLGGVRGVL